METGKVSRRRKKNMREAWMKYKDLDGVKMVEVG